MSLFGLWMRLDPWVRRATVVTIGSALGLDLFGRAVRSILYRVFPERLAAATHGMGEMELKYFRRDLRLYVGATLHAVIVFGVATYSFYTWYLDSRARVENQDKSFIEWFSYPSVRDLSPADTARRMEILDNRFHPLMFFMVGYILQDTLGLYGRLLRNKATLIHHVVTFLLCGSFSWRTDELTQFIPVITIIEGSTIFLDLAWVVKRLGMEKLNRYCMLAFAVSFFLLRVVFFQVVTMWIHYVALDIILSKQTVGIYIIMALQHYWFRLIYKKVRNPNPPPKKANST